MTDFIHTFKANHLVKIVMALILIFVFSSLYLNFTNPCKNSMYRQCDYYYGFPIPFWLVSDFISNELLVMFVGGIAGNIFIFYSLLSVIQHTLKK